MDVHTSSPARFHYQPTYMLMAFTKAIGLGIGIIVLKLLLPAVLTEIEQTAIAFLHGARVSATVATDLAASAGSVRFSNEPFELPRIPETRPAVVDR